MIVRFLTGRFIGDYDSSMEAIFNTSTSVDGKQCSIQIMDTATHIHAKPPGGQEFKDDPVTWADGFLLVFSLTDATSYRAVGDLVDTLRRAREDDRTPILVAANKSDLVHLRAVSLADTEASCLDQGCLFAEVSASEDPDSVRAAFLSLVRRCRAVNKKREKLSRTLQRPAVAAKLQIQQSLRHLAERKWRSRTSTM